MSVEQTLAGLTQAMSALHGDQSNSPKYGGDERFSSADAFAHNATRLSEQQDESEGPIRRNPRAWRIDNLPVVEENETPGRKNQTAASLNGDKYATTSDDDLEEASFAEDSDEADEERPPDGAAPSQKESRKRKSRRSTMIEGATDQLKTEWEAWGAFFRPRKAQIQTYAKNVLLYIIAPLVGIASILFYFFDNPTTGESDNGEHGDKASASWWMLFTVRQVITFSLALAIQGMRQSP
jgi:hypothetical protein